jgi:uncharacterized membrane protein YkvA (DUF1232 family)
MKNKEEDYYKSLRRKINKWVKSDEGSTHKYVEYILAAPDFFYVLWQLMLDGRIPSEFKIKVGLVVAYFISPIDFIPEAVVGPIGYLDDVALSAGLLNNMMENYGDIIEEHWEEVSDINILNLIQSILKTVDNLIGRGMWDRLCDKFDI